MADIKGRAEGSQGNEACTAQAEKEDKSAKKAIGSRSA